MEVGEGALVPLFASHQHHPKGNRGKYGRYEHSNIEYEKLPSSAKSYSYHEECCALQFIANTGLCSARTSTGVQIIVRVLQRLPGALALH